MKILTAIIMIIVTAYLSTIFLTWQWWFIAVITFLYAVILHMRPSKSFLTGFLGAALFWGCLILKQDIANEHILSGRMSKLFFGSQNVLLFIFVNAILGGIVGGLAGWSGGLMNRAFNGNMK